MCFTSSGSEKDESSRMIMTWKREKDEQRTLRFYKGIVEQNWLISYYFY